MKLKQNTIALLLVCIVVAASGLRIWSSYCVLQVQGPQHISVNTAYRQLMLYLDGVFYRLNDAGRVVDTIQVEELGLSEQITGLQWMSDGRLLVGDLQTRRIYRCELTSHRCIDLAPADTQAIKQQFHFYFSELEGQIYISDTKRDRLLVHDIERNSLRELRFVEPNTLSEPKALDWYNGALWVADSQNARILQLYPDYFGRLIIGGSFNLKGNGGLDGYQQPLSFVHDYEDNLWVIAASNALSDTGKLLRLDQEGKLTLQPDWQQLSGLTEVVSLRDKLYLVDKTHFELYQFDVGALQLKPIAKDALRQHLDALADEYYFLLLAKYIATYTMLGAVVLLGLLGIRNMRKRVQSHTMVQPKPITYYHKLTWLCPESHAVAHFNRIIWAVVGLMFIFGIAAIAFVSLAYLRGELDMLLPFVKLIIVLALVLPLLLWLMLLQAKQLLKTQIAADAQYLYLSDQLGMVYQIEPANLVYTKRQLAYKGLVVPLVGPFGETLFPTSLFEQQIRPLLVQGTQVGEVSMMLYQVIQGNRLQRAALLLIILTIMTLLIV